MEETLSHSLQENLDWFGARFAAAMDWMVRPLALGPHRAAFCAVDGLINKEAVTHALLAPMLAGAQSLPASPEEALACLESRVLRAADLRRENRRETLLFLLQSGFGLILLDGCDQGLVSGVQGFAYRSPQEPPGEVTQRGAKDGFTESNQLNMAMLRRRMKNTALQFLPLEVGTRSRTPVVLAWLEGVASPAIVEAARRRLEACPLETVLGAEYLSPFLQRGRVFSGMGDTQRPDVACGKLNEGRVAVLVEGTPTVLLLPFLFAENFQTMDDYLARPFYGAFLRWLKGAAFFLSACLPGAYAAVALHHPEALPENLLYTLAQARQDTPFPLLFETLTLTFFYEVLREASLRAPRALSATVSIVGGLVLGDTAVAAGLVSAPSLLVVALTAVAGYAVPRLYEPLTLARLGLLLLGSCLGLWGVTAGVVFLLFDLCGEESFGVPALSPVSPYQGRLAWRDVFLRRGWRTLSRGAAPVQDMPGAHAPERGRRP